MKNIKILIFLGLIIIVTSIVCFSGKNYVYQKKMYFNSPEEIIDILNSRALNAYDEVNKLSYHVVNTDDFKECLSKRKRVTGSLVDFKKLNVKIDENCDEETLINDYKVLTNHFIDYKVSDKVKAYTLVGTYETLHETSGNIKINIVFVDEGEGYVIDYIVSTYLDDSNQRVVSE